jgi:hypothetical protein
MEFAQWVQDMARTQLILRLDIQRLPQFGDTLDAGIIGHFEDDEGRESCLIRIQFGFDRKKNSVRYYRWWWTHNTGIWNERGAVSQWPKSWKKEQKPIVCRYRATTLAVVRNAPVVPWTKLDPRHQTSLQAASQVRGVVRSLLAKVSGPYDPYVLHETDRRLAAYIAQGNRELNRLVA